MRRVLRMRRDSGRPDRRSLTFCRPSPSLRSLRPSYAVRLRRQGRFRCRQLVLAGPSRGPALCDFDVLQVREFGARSEGQRGEVRLVHVRLQFDERDDDDAFCGRGRHRQPRLQQDAPYQEHYLLLHGGHREAGQGARLQHFAGGQAREDFGRRGRGNVHLLPHHCRQQQEDDCRQLLELDPRHVAGGRGRTLGRDGIHVRPQQRQGDDCEGRLGARWLFMLLLLLLLLLFGFLIMCAFYLLFWNLLL